MKKLLCSLFCVLLAAVLSIAACAQDTGKSNVASDLLPDLSMGSGLSLQSDSADLDAAYTGLYNGLKSYSDFSRNKPVIVTVPSGFTEDDISALYFNVLYEHPELFWFSSAVGFSYSTRTIGSVTYCNYYPVFMPDFNTSALLTPAQEAFSAALAQAKSECFPGGDASKMPVVERLLSVHDWVISHCQYDRLIANSQSGESKNVYTAYGVLVDGNAVCQGYSLAVNLLLNGDSPQSASDFISYSVTSTALNHMWNIVKIGDSWYHFDATFDDPVYSLGSGSSEYYDLPGAASHEHFLLSTAEITAKESGRSDFAGRYGYACTASYTGSKPWAGCRMPFCFDDASDAMILQMGTMLPTIRGSWPAKMAGRWISLPHGEKCLI